VATPASSDSLARKILGFFLKNVDRHSARGWSLKTQNTPGVPATFLWQPRISSGRCNGLRSKHGSMFQRSYSFPAGRLVKGVARETKHESRHFRIHFMPHSVFAVAGASTLRDRFLQRSFLKMVQCEVYQIEFDHHPRYQYTPPPIRIMTTVHGSISVHFSFA